MSRVIEWLSFSDVVTGHVENYTVKQFGDLPDDSLSTYTVEELSQSHQQVRNPQHAGE